MKVIGFRKSSFKGDDGQEVSGVNLFLTEKCEKGEGLSCDRIYDGSYPRCQRLHA